jgi:hypothetical protein
MPEQVIPMRMRREPRNHRNAKPIDVISQLVEIRTVDARINQNQTVIATHDDSVAPHPFALPHPDAVGHLLQHSLTLSGDENCR